MTTPLFGWFHNDWADRYESVLIELYVEGEISTVDELDSYLDDLYTYDECDDPRGFRDYMEDEGINRMAFVPRFDGVTIMV